MNNRMKWTEYHERKVLKLYRHIKSEWKNDRKFTYFKGVETFKIKTGK